MTPNDACPGGTVASFRSSKHNTMVYSATHGETQCQALCSAILDWPYISFPGCYPWNQKSSYHKFQGISPKSKTKRKWFKATRKWHVSGSLTRLGRGAFWWPLFWHVLEGVFFGGPLHRHVLEGVLFGDPLESQWHANDTEWHALRGRFFEDWSLWWEGWSLRGCKLLKGLMDSL